MPFSMPFILAWVGFGNGNIVDPFLIIEILLYKSQVQLGHDGTSCLPHHIQDLKCMGLDLLGQAVQPSSLVLSGLVASKLHIVIFEIL
jgi:hypothetical protein